jgi:hypothetical protein
MKLEVLLFKNKIIIKTSLRGSFSRLKQSHTNAQFFLYCEIASPFLRRGLAMTHMINF